MKDLANEVGLAHGFSPIDFRKPSKDKIKSREKQLILRGGVGWKDELKDVISAAKLSSASFDEFAQNLQNYGITIERNTAKTISFKHPEKQKPVRGNSLGEDFTKEEIIRAITEYANRATANATQSIPGIGTSERTVAGDGRAIADGAGKHNAQTDIDRISRTIQDIENTAGRFSPASGKPLPAGQKDSGHGTARNDNVEQGADRQHRKRDRQAER